MIKCFNMHQAMYLLYEPTSVIVYVEKNRPIIRSNSEIRGLCTRCSSWAEMRKLEHSQRRPSQPPFGVGETILTSMSMRMCDFSNTTELQLDTHGVPISSVVWRVNIVYRQGRIEMINVFEARECITNFCQFFLPGLACAVCCESSHRPSFRGEDGAKDNNGGQDILHGLRCFCVMACASS